jgi:hypothetical protein
VALEEALLNAMLHGKRPAGGLPGGGGGGAMAVNKLPKTRGRYGCKRTNT